MIFVNIKGGLGNQMFQYAFFLSLYEVEKNAHLFLPFSTHDIEYGHQGYELQKLFNVRNKMPIRYQLYFMILKIFKRRPTIQKMKYIGCDIYSAPQEFSFYEKKDMLMDKAKYYLMGKSILYDGYWQSEKYFSRIADKIISRFSFNRKLLSSLTLSCENEMTSLNSISIHIRRGDYLDEAYKGGFSKCTSIRYYKEAIEYMNNRVNKPVYYIFSDDMNWARENINIPNARYVDWNNNSDSWQNMFLMSCCKHNIIANSSFSWWGAYLNKNIDKIVIAPRRWWYYLENDDVVPESWIRM